jgi:UDP-N-acetylglucosamine 2-epimerase (non-hydrolysing)
VPPTAVLLGSAAEVLRLAPVVHALRRRDAPHVVVAAGRPSRMLDDMLATFAIAPQIDVRSVARADAVAAALGRALAFVRPSAVVLAAGTATERDATPAAFSRGIPVAQVGGGRPAAPAAPAAPAGERRLLAHLAAWHFAPDEAGRAALAADGVDPGAIEVTGSLVAEAVHAIAERDGLLARRPPAGPRRVLVALRRGAGGDDADRAAGAMLARLAERADVEIAIAAPRSPVLRDAVAAHENVRLLGCPRYASFVAALAGSDLLLSDATDALDAAVALGVPTVAAGDPALAGREAERALDDAALHRPLRLVPGSAAEDGAAARIVARVSGARSGAAADVHSARLAA